MFDVAYNALISLNYPVKEQGSYPTGTVLPETYVTYFIVDSPNTSFADNVPTSKTTRIQIVMYSKKPTLVQNADKTFKDIMLPAGFLRAGGGSLPFNEKTGHYAWRNDYKYYEMEE